MHRAAARLGKMALLSASIVPVARCLEDVTRRPDSCAADLVSGNARAHGMTCMYQTVDNTAHTFRAVEALIARGDEDPAGAIRAACGLRWTALLELLVARYPAPRDTVVVLLEALVREGSGYNAANPMTAQFERVVVAAYARGADPAATCDHYGTPMGALALALMLKSGPLVRLLLRHGIDAEQRVTIREAGGAPLAPIDAATKLGLSECYCALLEAQRARTAAPPPPPAPPPVPDDRDLERLTWFAAGAVSCAVVRFARRVGWF